MKRIRNRKWIALVLVALCVMSIGKNASAASDGAYTVDRTISYANPDTGVTADGSTNIALGESMANRIVENQVLVEYVGSKTYVTIGLGMMSNVSNVTFEVKQANGTYKQVSSTITGTSTKDDDRCNHYRIEVPSDTSRISPILYIAAMGREVQFYMDLKLSTKAAGTGIYNSEMVKVTEVVEETTPQNQATSTPTITAAPQTTVPAATASPLTGTTTNSTTTNQTTESTTSTEPTTSPSTTESPSISLEDRIEASEGIVLNEIDTNKQEDSSVEQIELQVERGMTIENVIALTVLLISGMSIQYLLCNRKKHKAN